MKKYILFLLIGLQLMSASNTMKGQNSSKEKKPYNLLLNSPNAASLSIYGEIPVGYYTGTPKINIPIFDIDLDGLKIPISISYHASGIRVQQESSWVGLGWALNAGGQITATINGYQDHEETWTSECIIKGFYESKKLFKNYFDTSSPYPKLPNGSMQLISNNFIRTMRECDTEPDVYIFNFNTYSGKMITGGEGDQNSEIIKGILLSPNQYIDFSYNLSTWVATDPMGYKYYFGTKESTTTGSTESTKSWLLSPTMDEKSHKKGIKEIINAGNDRFNISAWMLDSIVSPTRKKIVFEYIIESIQSPLSTTECATFFESENIEYYSEVSPYPPIPQYSYHLSVSNLTQALLKKITWDEGYIIFDTSDREDLITVEEDKKAQKLSNLKIYNNKDVLLRNYLLEYIYHGENIGFQPYNSRILLSKIKEQVSNSIYSFTYNMAPLPYKHSINCDFWGFFNGPKGLGNHLSSSGFYTIPPAMFVQKDNGRIISIPGANKMSDSISVLHGVLETITYPTGGKTLLSFEPHYIAAPYSLFVNPGEMIGYDYKMIAAIPYSKKRNPDLQNETELICPFELKYPTSKAYFYISEYPVDGIIDPGFDLYEPEAIIKIQKLENGKYIDMPLSNRIPPIKSQQVKITQEGDATTVYLDLNLDKGSYRLLLSKDQYVSDNHEILITFNPYQPVVTDDGVNVNNLDYRLIGGLRIKETANIINNKKEVIKYTYLSKDRKNSSGTLMAPPYYARYTMQVWNNLYDRRVPPIFQNKRNYLEFTTSPFRDADYSAQGSIVGYSDVQVYHSEQNGYINYSYTNIGNENRRMGNIKIPNVDTGFNGLLLEETYYNNDNKPVRNVSYKYKEFVHKSHYAFAKDTEQLWRNYDWNEVLLRDAIEQYYIPSISYLLEEQKTVNYEESGDICNITSYEYDDTYLLLKSEQKKSSQGNTIKSSIKYPFDYKDAIHKKMVNKGMVGVNIEKILSVDNLVTNATKVAFCDTLGMFLLSKTDLFESSKSCDIENYTSKYKKNSCLSSYNQYGKPGLMLLKDNINTIYLWSYLSKYPIAEITNASYKDVENAVKNIFGVNNINELAKLIIPDESKLQNGSLQKNLSEALVTTYTYDPLIGIKTMTDPRGVTTHYDYDGFGRLKEVYIKETPTSPKRVVESYDYKYANQ